MVQKLIWFRKNAGEWNGSPSADPGTSTGGIDISGLNAPYYAAAGYNTGFVGGQTLTANFSGGFAETPPSGASAWGSGTTWDPAFTNPAITLNSGNLSFTTGGEQTGPATRSTTNTNTQTGLRYWEFVANEAPQNWYAGIASANAPNSLDATPGAGEGFALVGNDGAIVVGGTVNPASVPSFSASDVMCIAVALVYQPPGPPSPSCGLFHAPTGFTAAWAPGSGDPAFTYTLQYRQVGTMDFTTIDNIADTNYFITGLSAATQYEFKVAGVNPGGTGAYSSLQQCSTDSAVLDQAVPTSLGRWRGGVGLNWNGLALVGDAFSNVIGVSDFNVFTEYGIGMRMRITSPPVHVNRKRVFIPLLEIEVEAGLGEPGLPTVAPVIVLSFSRDGGNTWFPLRQFRSMGAAGEYTKRLRWINLGNARQWIFRFEYSGQARPTIIGTYLNAYAGLG